MKNLKAALACISLAALSGCSSEIDVIREGRLELLPEYTVGQALDNRKLCESTDWSVIEDAVSYTHLTLPTNREV